MKKSLFTVIAVLILQNVFAHEGMWLINMLNRINHAEMQELGLNLTPDEIYSINNASLKDAIVMLNGGSCTAEVISNQGLVLTNHHCAYGAVQQLSTVESDYLTNGFWAMSKDQELPIPGFEVSFLVRVEDVTTNVLSQLTDDMSEADRAMKINEITTKLGQEASEGGKFDAMVKSFFYGNEFYLFVYNTYRDVRLVGVPPESIGKFGGDTDNWMWPRHTGDFSMIRIYADGENNPADFSENNKPYTPKHHLPVSIAGVDNDDFTMILGYPGSTDRFLSSYGVQQAINLYNPSVVEVRDLKLKTMKKYMDKSEAVRIQYAAKYAQTANYWKYYIGQTNGLKRLDVYSKKRDIESEFQEWANADPTRKAKYGDALSMMEEYYNATDATVKGKVYSLEAGLIGPDINLFAFRLTQTYGAAQQSPDAEAKDQILGSFIATADDFFKDYDQATDKDLFIQLMSLYKTEIPKEQLPTIFTVIDTSFGGSVEAFANQMYKSSFVVNKAKLNDFLRNPDDERYEADLAVMTGKSLIAKYRESFVDPVADLYDKGYRLFVDGLRQMNSDKNYAPDANSTMRLTYGVVGDYEPKDGVTYDFETTANGILEKKDNTDPEFMVDKRLETLIRNKNYGQYADENGELITCFISNNDITGGNSGSPVINGDGELVGVAFDGNWEAMSGDIAFETELQRTISVDIRYVLFIVDKYAGATNLIEEMTVVNNQGKKKKKKKKRCFSKKKDKK